MKYSAHFTLAKMQMFVHFGVHTVHCVHLVHLLVFVQNSVNTLLELLYELTSLCKRLVEVYSVMQNKRYSAKAGFSPQNHAKHLNCRGRPQDWQNWLTAETSSKTMQCQSSFLYKRQIKLGHSSLCTGLTQYKWPIPENVSF